MTSFSRGDVVISVNQPDSQRNMSVVVPMTTEIRGGECEIRFPKPAWLRQESAVNVLGIAGVETQKSNGAFSTFPADKMLEIESVLK